MVSQELSNTSNTKEQRLDDILPEHKSLEIDFHDADLEYVTPVSIKPSLSGVPWELAEKIREDWRSEGARSAKDVLTILTKNDALEKADIDVTGLHGKKTFKRDVEAFFDRSEPGALAMFYLDLNGLKRINDNVSHRAGNEYLVTVSDKLLDIFRPEDRIYRVGGDELVVLLSGHYSEEIMDTIKHRMDESLTAEVDVLSSRVRQDSDLDEDLYLGVSIGGSIKEADDSLANFIDRADQACERSKRDFYDHIEQTTGRDIRR